MIQILQRFAARAPRPRSSGQVALLLVAVWSAFVVALPSIAKVPTDAAALKGPYRLEIGDQITVFIMGQPDLSGELQVDEVGNVALPLAGLIEVKGLTASQAQQRIADRLSGDIIKQPWVTVRVSQVRPLYVLGDVRAPGSFPFRNGTIVKTVVSLAGGYGVGSQLQNMNGAEVAVANERVRQLQQQEVSLIVRRARLEAQLDGLTSLKVPQLGPVTDPDVVELVGNETQVLEASVQATTRQRQLVHSQRDQMHQVISSLTKQIAVATKQIEVGKQQMLYHESLVKKGLVRGAMAGYELARGEAVREAELARLGGDRARLGLQAAELEMRLNEFETSNRRQLMTELQDVRSRLRELSVSLPSASVALNYVMHQSNVGGLAPEPVRNITITRTQNGSTSVFEATELMPLEPGDVVEVKTWIAPSSSRSLNTQASTSLRRLAADRR